MTNKERLSTSLGLLKTARLLLKGVTGLEWYGLLSGSIYEVEAHLRQLEGAPTTQASQSQTELLGQAAYYTPEQRARLDHIQAAERRRFEELAAEQAQPYPLRSTRAYRNR